jgi:hypothetical protein
LEGETKLRLPIANLSYSPSYRPPIDAERFLEAAKKSSDLPYLRGREKTAEILGFSYAEAKRLVAKLVEDGKIAVEGKRPILSCQGYEKYKNNFGAI